MFRVGSANNTVDAIGSDQEIIRRKLAQIGDIAAKTQLNTLLAATLLQNREQHFSRNTGNDMAATTYSLTTIQNVDIIPEDETIGDLLVGFVVSTLERGKRAVRKHHAPAISDICRIALENSNAVRGVIFFDEQTGIQTCRASTKNNDVHHAVLPSPSRTSASRSIWPIRATAEKKTTSWHPASSKPRINCAIAWGVVSRP